MTELVGRRVTFTRTNTDGVAITGLKSKNLTINNEAIDVTTDDDSGWRKLLAADPAMRMLDLQVEGVTKDAQLISAVMSGGSLISEYTLNIPGIGEFSGEYHIGNVTIGANFQDAVTFTADVKSSGPQTFTPAALN